MLLDFGYLEVYFLFFLQKAENNRLKKASWPNVYTIFLCLLKVESVGHVDQHINLVSPYNSIF